MCLQVEEQYIRKLQFDSRIRILEQSWENLFLQITHRYVLRTPLREIFTILMNILLAGEFSTKPSVFSYHIPD